MAQTFLLQVFSDDEFIGSYPLLILSRPGGSTIVVGDQTLTLTDSSKVTLIVSVSRFTDQTGTGDPWLFYIRYYYPIPNGVGEFRTNSKARF
jgi:hypothetical protein